MGNCKLLLTYLEEIFVLSREQESVIKDEDIKTFKILSSRRDSICFKINKIKELPNDAPETSFQKIKELYTKIIEQDIKNELLLKEKMATVQGKLKKINTSKDFHKDYYMSFNKKMKGFIDLKR